MYERHTGKPAHEPANGVTTYNKVPLQPPREGTGMARQLPSVGLQVCVVFELLSKEAQFECGPGVLEGPKRFKRRER